MLTDNLRRLMTKGIMTLLVFLASPALGQNNTTGPWERCATAVAAAEAEFNIPTHLLVAISLAESGRRHKDSKQLRAWPWALNINGKSHYPATRNEAIAKVRQAQNNDTQNIDIGCMQINLLHHAGAFVDLEQAFEPETNATYAASFLRRLNTKHGSWSRAVGYYHSGRDRFSVPYRRSVMRIWREQLDDPPLAWPPPRLRGPWNTGVPEPVSSPDIHPIRIDYEPSLDGPRGPQPDSQGFLVQQEAIATLDQSETVLGQMINAGSRRLEQARVTANASRKAFENRMDKMKRLAVIRQQALTAYGQRVNDLSGSLLFYGRQTLPK